MESIINPTSCLVSMNTLLVFPEETHCGHPVLIEYGRKSINNALKILALYGILGHKCTPFYHSKLLNFNAPKVSVDEIFYPARVSHLTL